MFIKKLNLCLLICLVISGFLSLQAQDMVTVYPEEYHDALSNPLKGFRPGSKGTSKYPTVVHDYIRWNEIENDASDGVDKIINFCNSQWAVLPAQNVKVIPRVYLDWDSNPGNEYWPADLKGGDWYSQEFKDRLVNLIYKLGEAWDNDPRVAWVQTGLIGYWGEQENPVGIDDNDNEFVKIMGPAFEHAFPNKMLLVRNQNYWDQEGYDFGVYWDSFAHPGQESGSWTRIRSANAKGRYLIQPVEGEVAYNWGEDVMDPFIGGEPDITLGTPKFRDNLIDVIRELHCSALGWVADYNQYDPNVAAGAALVQKEFGYRFVIPEFSCSGRVEPGGTLEISFKVKNVGAAPFYENWPLALVLIDESDHQIVSTIPLPDIDIRTWLPGRDYNYDSRTYTTPAAENEINASVTVPSDLTSGQYMAGLTILEPYSRTPGVFFAVENFLSESQTQPLCRIGVGTDVVGGFEIDSTIFDDPLLDDNRYYTLEWNGPTHRLTTNATTGGSVSPGSGDYPENRIVSLKATAELGYEFSGWSGDLSGSENPVKITMAADKNITANFISVTTYTLTTNAENGAVLLDPDGGTYNEGTVVTLTAIADLGYKFSNWSGDLSGADNPTTIIMDGDKTVTANFTAAPIYTLTTNASGGTISLDPPGPQYTEGTLVKVEAIPSFGFFFSRWSGDPLKLEFWDNPNYVIMDSDKNITAEFIADPNASNLIKNGDFSAGLNNWTPQAISPAQATISVINGECKIDIKAISDQEWHVNILQPGIQLESNVSYTLSFDARAENEKSVSAKAQLDHDPWTSSLEEPVNITTTMQRYSVTWLQEKPAESYKVGLFFGSDTTDVWVDNFELKTTTTSLNNEAEILLPQHTQLAQNYPNPFNPETTIPYQLSKNTHVKLEIINFLGQRVATLVNEQQTAGNYAVNWTARNDFGERLASGVYICRLETGSGVYMKKFVLLQ